MDEGGQSLVYARLLRPVTHTGEDDPSGGMYDTPMARIRLDGFRVQRSAHDERSNSYATLPIYHILSYLTLRIEHHSQPRQCSSHLMNYQ